MNNFYTLSNTNQLVIMDSIFSLKSKGYNSKKIQKKLNTQLGFKLKIKTIDQLSHKEESFRHFDNLLVKNLMY